ncbi:MAG TPA: CehA/McbA family metallohydrolase [Candidatus Acidoferrum sp.]|nr:CehA/McbA family metallohydrolase [Candidatus Acidoferrum sp.]
MKRALALVCFAMVWMLGVPAKAQRRPVLPQIDEPHPYYYRELYLPQLTSGPSGLAWGPDSKELIYSMAGSLWRQKLDSKEATQLTDGPGYDYQPDWSPDGNRVVYVSYQKDAMELWWLDLVNGKRKQLTKGGAVNVEPRWSPDGKRLVWVSTEYNGRFHIFTGDFADGELRNVTRLTGETKSSLPRYYYSAYDMEINPVWTRDGKEILFVSNQGHIHGTGGFWRMRAEPGAKAQEIHYEETSWKTRPDFSPDGSRMVYSSYLGRPWQNLWVMPAKGGDAFPLTYAECDETNVRWSPDGQAIAFISNQDGSTKLRWQKFGGDNGRNLEVEKRVYVRKRTRVTVAVAPDSLSAYMRVSVTDGSGQFYVADGAWIHADDGFDRNVQPFENHYFYTNDRGEAYLDLPDGKYTVVASGGLELKPFRKEVEIREGRPKEIEAPLLPLDFNPEGNWVASDVHVHMNYAGTYRNTVRHLVEQGEGEGLKVVHELTVNKEQRFPDMPFVRFGNDAASDPDVAVVQGQEFHTSYWGHRGILGLKRNLLLPGYAGYPNTAAASLCPMNADVYDMAHAQGALVGAVHPFDEVPDPFVKPAQRITEELPVDVALGKLDYMEIVGFSDHKATAAVWYKLLNLGFQIPAAGGTDATTDYAAPIRGQVGFDRVYVWAPGWPSDIGNWMDGLKRGKTFATNGPLVEFKLGGEMPGGELRFNQAQNAIPFTAKLRSIVPVDHLEVVCNGKVAQNLKLDGKRESADASGTVALSESGWCVLRAWSEKAEYPVMDNYEYATTSPVYVAIGGRRAYSNEDADYFKAWIDRTLEITEAYADWNSPSEKKYVTGRLREARAVYEHMGNSEGMK